MVIENVQLCDRCVPHLYFMTVDDDDDDDRPKTTSQTLVLGVTFLRADFGLRKYTEKDRGFEEHR